MRPRVLLTSTGVVRDPDDSLDQSLTSGEVTDIQHRVIRALRPLRPGSLAQRLPGQWSGLGPLYHRQPPFPPGQRLVRGRGLVPGHLRGPGDDDVHVLSGVLQDVAGLLHAQPSQAGAVYIDNLVIDFESAVPEKLFQLALSC